MSWLGTTVEVTIDRPLGSIHPTQDDIVYLLNYGFIAGIVAGDGEPIDAYVVGASTPIDSALGRVVAVVERRDDVEDKLVVAMPGSAPWTVTELAVGVHFQEQWFDSRVHTEDGEILVVADLRVCAKAIVTDGAARVALVRYGDPPLSHWALPGGRIEDGETDEETLRRELEEEIGVVEALIESCSWIRSCRFQAQGRTVHQLERTHIVRIGANDLSPFLTPGAIDEGITDVRWWSLEELRGTEETVYPTDLAALIGAGPTQGIELRRG